MGLKSESHPSGNRATNNVRGGKFKQEAVMKQVLETTRCTHTEAEEALAECNYDLEMAVNYIIDRNGDNVWTEQKKKTKKAEEEVARPTNSGFRGGKRGGRGFSSSNRDGAQPREPREHREGGPPREPREHREGGQPREHREGGQPREPREYREPREPREYREPREPREYREPREPREPREGGQFRDGAPRDARRGGKSDRVIKRGERGGRTEGIKNLDAPQSDETGVKPFSNGVNGNGKPTFAEKLSGKKQEYVNSSLGENQKKYSNDSKPEERANPQVGAPAPIVPKDLPNKAGPLSFAALVARGAPKPPPPEQPPTKSTTAAPPKEASPAPEIAKPAASVSDETQSSSNSESKPNETNTQSLTSQLKNDLGLSSLHMNSTATQNPSLISSTPSSAKDADKSHVTVEYCGADSAEGGNYHFGPASGQQQQQIPQQQVQPPPQQLPQQIKPEEPVYVQQNTNVAPPLNDYSRSHENDLYKGPEPVISKAAPAMPQPTHQQMHQMAAYSMQSQQPMMQNIPRRNLGYADTNSVTIQPERPQQPPQQQQQQAIREASASSAPSYQNYSKPPMTAASSMGHQQIGVHHQQSQQQQQMYNPMYNNFPYVNLYSPVAGREDQTPYANPYMPYQAFGMDMNLPHVIPHMPLQHQIGHQQHHQPQSGLNHQPQGGHREQHPQTGYSADKMQSYGQSNANANNGVGQNAQQQRESVPPPPGFSGAPFAGWQRRYM